MPPVKIECMTPVLPVVDVAKAAAYYIGQLGFVLDWDGGPVCSVSRDARSIMLKESPPSAPGALVWIGVDDASLFDDWRTRGVRVRQGPKNYSWAYEMKFEDLDGNVLWVGCERRNDLPILDDGDG